MTFRNLSYLALAAVGALPMQSQAQTWAGIVAPDRAIDWSKAGVAGGVPNRTTVCATLNPGATRTQINTAITNCPAGQVVYLNAGRYDLGSGGYIQMKNDVTLRGAGADKTKLYFTGRGNCGGIPSVICMGGGWIQGSYGSAPQNVANWTGGYAKGSTVITLSATANLQVGDILVLDQLNDSSDSSGVYVCARGGTCSYTDGAGDARPNRHQRQLVTVAAINGSQVSISSPIHMPNWRATQSPQVRWTGGRPAFGMGLEDLSIDMSGAPSTSGSEHTIGILGVRDSWVKGIRTALTDRSHVQLYQAVRITIRDNYFYGTSGTGGMTSYGIETFGASSDLLIENNILQHCTTPININDGGSGNVIGYNFTYDNYTGNTNQSASYWAHSPGIAMNLFEGNSGLGFTNDDWYGTVHFMTFFRNHLYGDLYENPVKQSAVSPINASAYSRFFNFVGNVLGKPGVNRTYEALPGSGESCQGGSAAIYCLGPNFATGAVSDSQVKPRSMRWGNWDTATNAVRWDPTEVPAGLTQFANPIPASQSLPASFYLSGKPAWFGSIPWPPVGPDVTGGNVSGYAGHAYKNPARQCWESSGIDAAYGASNVRLFAASSCYPGGGSTPAVLPAPANVRFL